MMDTTGMIIKVLLGTIVKACRVVNDKIQARLPVSGNLLELMLFELSRIFHDQFYLEVLYQTIFLLGFHELLRIGKLGQGLHVLRAANVHVGQNKNKILLLLYSSKTHSKANRPQKIKITAIDEIYSRSKAGKHFCPFKMTRKFIKLRGNYKDNDEQFFTFRDHIPVKPVHINHALKRTIANLGLNALLYGGHSLRTGRAMQMLKQGYSVEQIKNAGHWKSNAVYRYLR